MHATATLKDLINEYLSRAKWNQSLTDNRANADIVLSDEDADDGREEFGRRAASGHERRAGHILADVQLLRDDRK